jgi:hypothetical protein
MIVVIAFQLDDERYEELLDTDLHGDDLADLINENAINAQEQLEVYHFRKTPQEDIHAYLDTLWRKYEKPTSFTLRGYE